MSTVANNHHHVRTRPAFEKLLIGPVMIFGEMITGGHYLEVLRLGKQMHASHGAAPTYMEIHQGMLRAGGGSFSAAFYRGFMPWGLLQCAKGVPVLFVQHESMYHLRSKFNWSHNQAEKASGFIGGVAQAVFVNPFQKVKVSVVACEKLNSMSPATAIATVVRENGVFSLCDGIVPMMLRRSLDWGIRFGVSNECKNWMMEQKRRQGECTGNLSFYEMICCGLVGGAFSALTHPIDNTITNSMKPGLRLGQSRALPAVIGRMYRESGIQAFTRGWAIKVLDNAYHMAWMYGVGTVVYDWMDQTLRAPVHQP